MNLRMAKFEMELLKVYDDPVFRLLHLTDEPKHLIAWMIPAKWIRSIRRG